ncbi:hypothetical protein [Brevibacillus laterosporus]|uniref:Uncharacterized protein n=1 Tax=Brevibacillus laterosporus LMG 15441 TaxID=1042163 RepID=A0A075R637_BRELA|nr:hypothetical protein [Brevibacillus laterosporus]AIG26628.1 hypothetical protein BRLA_c023070 [Brevibacillus laterosporus LMG 15441]
MSENSGQSDGQQRNMGNRIEILGAELVANPKQLLPGGFEAEVVTFAFGAQSIDRFEVYALSVNRKAVIIEDGNIFGAAGMIPAIVPAWMITGGVSSFG